MFARTRRLEMKMRLILLTAVIGLVLAVPFQASAQERTLVVGGKNFTEQYILAHMIAELLKAHGYPAEAKPGLASGDVILSALRRGDIDMYVEYSGTAWTGFLKQPTEVGIDADWVYEQTAKGMKEQFGLDYLPTLGFSNAYVFAVPRAFAEEHGLEKISDLIPLAGRLTLGGTLAFMGDRPDGIRGAEAVYGFKFRRNRAMDHALLFQALQLRQVDVIVPFSTDGQVAALDLVVLEDDRGVFPPYHAGILVREDVLEENPGLREILEKLSGRIDERTMAELNYEVDGKRRDEREVALEFLKEQGLID